MSSPVTAVHILCVGVNNSWKLRWVESDNLVCLIELDNQYWHHLMLWDQQPWQHWWTCWAGPPISSRGQCLPERQRRGSWAQIQTCLPPSCIVSCIPVLVTAASVYCLWNIITVYLLQHTTGWRKKSFTLSFTWLVHILLTFDDDNLLEIWKIWNLL